MSPKEIAKLLNEDGEPLEHEDEFGNIEAYGHLSVSGATTGDAWDNWDQILKVIESAADALNIEVGTDFDAFYRGGEPVSLDDQTAFHQPSI